MHQIKEDIRRDTRGQAKPIDVAEVELASQDQQRQLTIKRRPPGPLNRNLRPIVHRPPGTMESRPISSWTRCPRSPRPTPRARAVHQYPRGHTQRRALRRGVERATIRRRLVEAVRRILGRLRLGTPGRVLAEIKLELLVEGLLAGAAGRVVAAVGEAATLLLELLLWWLLEVLVEGGHGCGRRRALFLGWADLYGGAAVAVLALSDGGDRWSAALA